MIMCSSETTPPATPKKVVNRFVSVTLTTFLFSLATIGVCVVLFYQSTEFEDVARKGGTSVLTIGQPNAPVGKDFPRREDDDLSYRSEFIAAVERLQIFKQQHSQEQLHVELNQCQEDFAKRHQKRTFRPLKDCPALAKRKYMVGYYSCPHQAGNRMHHFLNGFLWSVVTNRTFLWHYYDHDTCLDIGRNHKSLLCDMVGSKEDCEQVLELSDWIPSVEEWNITLMNQLSSPEKANWWSLHLPLRQLANGTRIDERSRMVRSKHPWHEGDQKFAGIDVYSQQVLRVGQLHSWDGSILMTQKNRKYFLNTTQARLTARDLFGMGVSFLYGMLFSFAFTFSENVQPDPTLLVDSRETTSIAVHSRHALADDDGSSVEHEAACLRQVLTNPVNNDKPCAVYMMSDRSATLENLKRFVEKDLKCQAVIYPHKNTTTITNTTGSNAPMEHGSHAGAGFWQEFSLISSAARYGFVGTSRSSSHLLEARMDFLSAVEGYSAPPIKCYLPDPQKANRHSSTI